MSVLFTHDIFSSQKYGGISRYFAELFPRLLALPEKSQSYTLFTGLHINHHIEGVKPATGFRVPAVPHTRFLRHAWNEIWQDHTASRTGADLFHITYPFRDPARYRRPFVITIHDMIPELFPSFFPQGKSASELKRAYCEKARLILAVSENTRNDLLRLFRLPDEKIRVIPHGVGAPVPAPAEKPGRPYVLFVGTLGLYKNFSLLLRAWKESTRLRKNFDLLVFGPEDPFQLPALREEKELGSGIRWENGNDARLLSVYSNASALVYPSLYEGFGMPVLEAMNQGCPVLCSSTPALQEVAGMGAEYFSPQEPGELKEVLESRLFSPAGLSELRERGRVRARLFSWEKCAGETALAYGSVL